MRVVLFSSSADAVGVSTHVLNLARLLSRSDLLSVVICPKEGWLSQKLAQYALPYKVVPMGFHWHEYPSSVARFCSVLRSFSSMEKLIVHCHGRFPLFIAALPMMFMRKAAFVATVHQFANASPPGMAKWKDHLEAAMLRRVRRVWCVSNALRSEVIKRVGSRHEMRVQTIPNWIDPGVSNNVVISREAHAGRAGGDGSFRICGVGRLSREKGFDLLVEAISHLVADGRDVVCDIFGHGPEAPNLQALIDRLRLEGRIALRGTSACIGEILPCYDVVAIPSRSESFGMVALEAFAASVPVVAGGVPGLREVVIHEQTGLLFEAGNPRSLALTLERLIASKALGSALVKEATSFLGRFVPTDALRDEVATFYRAALGTRRREHASTPAVL